MFRLDGKIALVTGASYGIGFAIAKGLANAGAKIVFNDINQELVNKGLASYAEKKIPVHGYVCDVTDSRHFCMNVAELWTGTMILYLGIPIILLSVTIRSCDHQTHCHHSEERTDKDAGYKGNQHINPVVHRWPPLSWMLRKNCNSSVH
mgnify:CR=1 FL=1